MSISRGRLLVTLAAAAMAISAPLTGSASLLYNTTGIHCQANGFTMEASALSAAVDRDTFLPGFYSDQSGLGCPNLSGQIGVTATNDDSAITNMYERKDTLTGYNYDVFLINVDRALTPAELAAMDGDTFRLFFALGITAQIPVLLDPLAIVYSDPPGCSLGDGLQLSSTTLTAIFLREVTTWNSPLIQADNLLNPNLPAIKACNQGISIVGTDDQSSVVFKDYLSKRAPAWQAYIPSQYGAPALIGAWPRSLNCSAAADRLIPDCALAWPGSVGFTEYRFARNSGLHIASVDNAAHQFSQPSLAGCTNNAETNPSAQRSPLADWSTASLTDWVYGYPVCFFHFYDWWLGAGDAAPMPRLEWRAAYDYINYVFSPEAQALLPAAGFAPLPQTVLDLDQQAVQQSGYSLSG